MSGRENLSDLLSQAFRNRQAEMRVAMPAKVTSYDFRAQKAVVQPLINRRYADGRIEPYPVINNVPVIFPRCGGASFTFPVKVGDTVLLVFSDRSIESWSESGGQVNPDDNRMHNINDAIAIPGLIPFSTKSMAKNNDDVLLTYAGAEIEIKKDGKINMKSPRVKIDAPEVYMTGNLMVKGDISDRDGERGTFQHFRDIYNIHVHPENGNVGPTDEPIQKVL